MRRKEARPGYSFPQVCASKLLKLGVKIRDHDWPLRSIWASNTPSNYKALWLWNWEQHGSTTRDRKCELLSSASRAKGRRSSRGEKHIMKRQMILLYVFVRLSENVTAN